ncbi:unnamed protein product [Eruca vesicaria subsp. sativa]|uniref:FAS1 domain-containing protein n=1 Tax=Eruca vesicaria subsp. sativa TaxID=29727 RepID=A0ABC8LX18_ERUVS|nr:unnamed protein product [Eruca vesicaria subsp. sativa]
MGPNATLPLCLFPLIFFSTAVTADNITKAFEKYSDFSTMNDLLIKTKLTVPISKYLTITLLAVNNKAISPIVNRSDVEVKNILMNHVILDYYDEIKFKGMKEKSIMFTTLYQTTGLGEEMNGFLNCTKSKGKVYFGSGVKGSPLVAEYVKELYDNPYNLSIIQISMPIVAPGLSLELFPPPPPPAPLAPPPSPTDAANAPGPEPADEDTTIPKRTTDSQEVDSPAPTPSADNEKIEAADKAMPSSPACKAGFRFRVVLLIALLVSMFGIR